MITRATIDGADTFTAATGRALIAEAREKRMLTIKSKLNPRMSVGFMLGMVAHGISDIADDAPVPRDLACHIVALLTHRKRGDLDGFLAERGQ